MRRKITLKNVVICIEMLHDLHQITAHSGSNSYVICVKSHGKVHGIAR